MASVNKVILLGRLGRDPEAKTSRDGATAICHLSVATSRKYKDREGQPQEETEWHSVAVFGRQAEVAQQYLQKGSEVYIEGRLRTRTYDKDGQKHYATEIICESLQLGAKPKAEGGAPSGFESPIRPTASAQSRAGSRSTDVDEDVPF